MTSADPYRTERLAEALRANLRRRKTQAREQAAGGDTAPPPDRIADRAALPSKRITP